MQKISARNAIEGTVRQVRRGTTDALVTVCRGHHNPIRASISLESVDELGLEPGTKVQAIVKSTDVMFALRPAEGLADCNQIPGTITRVVEGAVNGEVTLEDETGARIRGTITNDDIEAMWFHPGSQAVALVMPGDVMLETA